MILELIFATLVFVAVVWFLADPFFNTSAPVCSKISKEFGAEDLVLRKQEIISSLKDLELDHAMKKMSDSDFDAAYRETMVEGALVLKKMEENKDENE